MEMEAPLNMALTNEMSFNPQNAAASPSSDYVFVDQLLNFSNEEDGFVEEEQERVEEENETNRNRNSSVSAPLKLQLQQHHESDRNSNHSSTNSSEDEFWSVSSTDLEDLEWLSHLVADSYQQEYSAGAAVPSSVFSTEKPTTLHVQPLPKLGSNLKTPFPSKPRSKRAKISAGRLWSLMDSISSPAKKPKRNSAVEGSCRVQPPRRCGHCGVQKTPQWRAGPLGAKTLCNACGVRFKSGRLFPEYRPACSPTFSSEIHSNHHRKVLEMRRKQETEKGQSDLNPTVGVEQTRFIGRAN